MTKNIKNILFNTVKIAGAAILSMLLATLLTLDFAVSAGIVTILTIQPTKKETIQTAIGRFYAFVTALFISFLCFEIIGYTLPAFMIYLIIFVFICQIFRWYSSITMNSVLISHFLTLGNMNFTSISNEILIFIIGVGIGILANLHLKKNTDYILKLQQETDEQMKQILKKMSERLLHQDVSDYNEKSFQDLKSSILKAQVQANIDYNNQFDANATYDIDYIQMRDKQYHVLYEMYKNTRNLETTPVTAKIISDLFWEISISYHRENTVKELLNHFYEIRNDMKNNPLPTNRKEFEDRACLFILLNYIEEFLIIKQTFMGKY